MQFRSGHIYHVFNQGNDHQPLFFSRANYAFFLRKMRTLIQPHADFLAWCLMPNHYHWMLYVPQAAETLNYAIGKLQSSYSAAINEQEKRSGSLFRQHFKMECVTLFDGIRPTFTGNQINIPNPEKDYPKVCFDYIHNNPVRAGIVERPEEWEFSSCRDAMGLRNGTLINREELKKRGLI